MNGGGFKREEEETPGWDGEFPEALGPRAETELQFLTRRAMEESRLAKRAGTPKAAAAHSYLAAAYSAAVSKELAKQAELEALLMQIH